MRQVGRSSARAGAFNHVNTTTGMFQNSELKSLMIQI